ncbi:glycosyltransferase family 2 protein [Candidatus Saccharibacteria bacterium]|nr:glycosyltransferase family 2 protein [Candidatus Saccharibacteria bacterium]
MKKELELPLGKRTGLYRFFEILPGALSYFAVILLFLLSYFTPILAAIYLLLIISATLVKAIAVAFRTWQGFETMKKAERVDWRKRVEDLATPHEAYERVRGTRSEAYGIEEHIKNLKRISVAEKGKYPNPEKVYHAIIMVAYNEGLETLIPSIEAIREADFPNERIIFVFGYEARGGEEMRKNAEEIKKKYKETFSKLIIAEHPDGVKGEIKGKGPNLCFAAEKLSEYVRKKGIKSENVIVTSLDSDNRVSKGYLDYVLYEFITRENRQKVSYQPISLFTNNIWDAPAPMRVIAMSNSFYNVISTMRPHNLRNFASHSQPLEALEGMGYWSKRTIVEDGHQYWRSLFYFRGDYEVIPIRVPIYQDAVIGETLLETLKAQFIQLRRWDYGASDVAYVGVRLFDKKKRRGVPLVELVPKFIRLLDGHVTLAMMSPIVAFGGWVPAIMNLTARGMAVFNLPRVVSVVQTIAVIGLFVTILTSLRLLPERPKKYKKVKGVMMVLQWILMPVIALVYTSLAAYYSQTRLMIGKYMEKFDVTRKVVKK